MTEFEKDLFVETSLGLPSGGTYLRHGDKVPAGLFSAEVIERLISKGVLVRVLRTPAPAQPSAGGGGLGLKIESNQERDRSRWAYPNEMLDGRSLDALNAMILDHVALYQFPAVEPFETVEEARAFLQHELTAK